MEIWNEILYQIHFIPQSLLVAGMLVLSYLFIVDNRGVIKERIVSLIRRKWETAFLCYTAFLFTTTIIARYRAKPVYSGVGMFGIYSLNGKINMETIVNIFLYIPYTFLCMKAFSIKRILITSFLMSILSSVFVETFQYLFWVGQFTIADIIHNTFGGMIGCIIYYLQIRIMNVIKKK